jgi:hypothetical protein
MTHGSYQPSIINHPHEFLAPVEHAFFVPTSLGAPSDGTFFVPGVRTKRGACATSGMERALKLKPTVSEDTEKCLNMIFQNLWDMKTLWIQLHLKEIPN